MPYFKDKETEELSNLLKVKQLAKGGANVRIRHSGSKTQLLMDAPSLMVY